MCNTHNGNLKCNTSFSCRDRKGANASHQVNDSLSVLEEVEESLVLRVKPRVPVHLAVVELENAPMLPHLRLQIVFTGDDFHVEDTKLIFNRSDLLHKW